MYLALYELVILLFIGLTGVVVYRMRESRVLTIPEYYEKRYSRGVRVLGGVMMVTSGVLNMGLFLKAGSLFLVSVTGLGLQEEIGLKLIMTGLLLLVLFYTVLGGMISVVITDLIQFVILGTAMVVVTLFVVGEVGIDGFSEVVTQQHGYYDPTATDNPSTAKPDDGIGPLTLTSQAVVLIVALMLWPTGVSRTLAVKTPEIARKLYLCSTIPFLARRSLPVLWGIGAFALFHSHPALNQQFQTAIAAGGDINTQAAMPLFLAKIIPSGLLGLVTAGMVAAFMSTHDSYLLCWSGVITQDVVAPLTENGLTEKQRILVTRIAIVATGIMLLIWGLWYEVSSNLWKYMAVTGTVYLAGVFPVVIGGLYWSRSSTAGAYVALLGGLTGILGLDPCISFLNAQLVALDTNIVVNNDIVMLMTFVMSAAGFVAGSLLFPDDRSNLPQSATDEGAVR